MKKFSTTFAALAFLLCLSPIVCAQGGAKQGPDLGVHLTDLTQPHFVGGLAGRRRRFQAG